MTIALELDLHCAKCRKVTSHIYLMKEHGKYIYNCSICNTLKRIWIDKPKEERFIPEIIKITNVKKIKKQVL